MQTKFIAGPWAIFHDHPDPETAKDMATIRPVGAKPHENDVCNVYLCDYEGETGERARATARLIAAAPELLEALDGMLKLTLAFIGSHSDNEPRNYPPVLAAIAAIAKATGDQS